MTNLLEMQGISKTFPGVKALDDVSLTVAQGEIHAICGENGAGKSTLMKVLSGVYPTGSYDGRIVFDGQPVDFRTIRDSEDRGIIIIHQELALVPLLTIAENIFLGNERATRGVIDWPETFRQTEALLAKVGFDPVFGARPLKRAIQQRIENPLSRLILEGRFPPKSAIPVEVDPVREPGVFHFGAPRAEPREQAAA